MVPIFLPGVPQLSSKGWTPPKWRRSELIVEIGFASGFLDALLDVHASEQSWGGNNTLGAGLGGRWQLLLGEGLWDGGGMA